MGGIRSARSAKGVQLHRDRLQLLGRRATACEASPYSLSSAMHRYFLVVCEFRSSGDGRHPFLTRSARTRYETNGARWWRNARYLYSATSASKVGFSSSGNEFRDCACFSVSFPSVCEALESTCISLVGAESLASASDAPRLLISEISGMGPLQDKREPEIKRSAL